MIHIKEQKNGKNFHTDLFRQWIF